MTKKRGEKKQIIGRIQLVFGIILLLTGIIGLVMDYNNYKDAVNQNVKTFINGFNSFNSLKNNSIISNDTALLGGISYGISYSEENYQIIQESTIIGLMLALIIIISILFITQGLKNSLGEDK